MNDLPTFVQSAVSEDRIETTKCFDLGENRTEDLKFGGSRAVRNIRATIGRSGAIMDSDLVAVVGGCHAVRRGRGFGNSCVRSVVGGDKHT